MMLCVRMSTCSCCARSNALRSGRTPNAITIAPDAEARSTSFSVTAPTPEPMIFSFTWSVESFGSISLSTSTEPCTSPLITIPNSLTSPAFNCSCSWSSVMREPLMRGIAASRGLFYRYSTIYRAWASSVTWKRSPASGTPCKPNTSTGVDGGASVTTRPRSSNIARTLPNTDPQMKKSPAFSVPFCSKIVATGPRPLSTRDSSTVPVAGASGLALSSRKSATSKIVSSSLSMPCFFFAETSTNSVSPPHSAGIKLFSVSCRFANRVQQTRFAVIDVAHYRHHRWTRLQTFLGLFLRNFQHHLFFEGNHVHHSAERLSKCRSRRHVQRLVDAREDAAVEQVIQQVFRTHIQLFGKFANRDAFGNRHVAWRTGLRRRDNRRGCAAARAWTLPCRMQLALALLLALVQNRALALRRLTRIQRLARLRLRRQFLWKRRRQHARTPGRSRAWPRACRHRAAALLKWARLRSTWTARAS